MCSGMRRDMAVKTPGAVFLRKIMHKLNMVDASLSSQHWGHFYRGYDSRQLTEQEQMRRTYIETGAFAKSKARKIVAEMDSSQPFLCRLEFIEALAALAAVFSEDMDRKVTGANQRISHVLWCAADPDRAEWYFNNQRFRRTLTYKLVS